MQISRAWVLAQVGAVAVVLAAGTSAATAAPGSAAVTATAPSLLARTGATTAVSRLVVTRRITIASYNLRNDVPESEALADLARLGTDGADVMGLQEMSSRARRLAMTQQLLDCETCTYDGYVPTDAPGQGSTPILWKQSKFLLLEAGSVKVSDPTFVGREGAGPSTTAPKYVNYVRLRHMATGRAIYVMNSHAVASVQAGTEPNYDNPERLALYQQHMDVLKALTLQLQAGRGQVFTTGDYNVNYRSDSIGQNPLFPYASMHSVNMTANWEALGMPTTGTHSGSAGHGTRLIDYVYFAPHRALTPVEQTIESGYSSDHRPVLVTFTLRVKRG